MKYLLIVLFFACTKQTLYTERWKVIHATSQVSGGFCYGLDPHYDTVIVYVPKTAGTVDRDSVVEGTYYYTYYIKKL